MRIVFLYAEMVPSWIPTLKTLVANYQAEVIFVHWNGQQAKTPFVPPAIHGVSFIPRSGLDSAEIQSLIYEKPTDIVVISGWMDKGYLSAVRKIKAQGVPIVACFDDWWIGSIRQKVGALVFPFHFRNFFSHAWVAGPRQYEFARRLGFDDGAIIHNLLTCDVDLFRAAANPNEPKQDFFLYVGRFAEEKGIRTLAAANAILRGATPSPPLRCYGNGPLEDILRESGAEVHEFSDQPTLAKLMATARAVIVPSKRDFSPLVLHEATCAGAPVIVSDMVGNKDAYAINNWNSKVFKANRADSLADAIGHVSAWTADQCKLAGQRSLELSMNNSPSICAASLLSLSTSPLRTIGVAE